MTLIATLLVVALVVLVAAVNAITVESEFLFLNAEFSLSSLASAVFFALAGVISFRVARDGSSPLWGVICAAAVLLAVETLVGVHDRLEHIEGVGDLLFMAYPIVGLLVLAVGVKPIAGHKAPVPLLLFGAIAALVISQAAGAMLAYEHLSSGGIYYVDEIIEEGGEMLTGALLLTAAVAQATLGKAGGGVASEQTV